MITSHLRSTAVDHDTSTNSLLNSGIMYGHNQVGCMARFPVEFTPVLLPEAWPPMPLPKTRRVVSAAFISGAAPPKDRLRPLLLGRAGFLRTVCGPRSPIGSRKAGEIQLVNAGLKIPLKSLPMPTEAKNAAKQSLVFSDMPGEGTIGSERERQRLVRRQSIPLPKNIAKVTAHAHTGTCCSNGNKSNYGISTQFASTHQSSTKLDREQPRSTRPYSTSSVVNPNSSLLSPPSSPELSYRKLDVPAFDVSKPFELPQSRPRSEPAAISDAPFPKLAETPISHARLSVPAARVAKPPRHKTSNNSKNTPSDAETRICYSCGAKESPCWRPSWSIKCGQLCNSCGLRYRKTRIYCPSVECRYVPSKIELAELRANPSTGMKCPHCATKLHLK